MVGGGVVGLACARALLRAGRSVSLLERDRIGAGASPGNCGLITPSHALPLCRPGMMRKVLGWMLRPDAPIYVRPRFDLGLVAWGLRFARRCSPAGMQAAMAGRAALLEPSRALFDDWAAEGIECEWRATGLLEVFASEEERGHAAQVARLLADHGIASDQLGPDELRAAEPSLREGLAGALRFPRDAHLRPERLLQSLTECVRAEGGTIEEEVEVRAVVRDGTSVRGVATNRGERLAGEVVLATGAWAPHLARGLGLRVPVQPGKGYSITGVRPAACPTVPLLLKEANMVVTPWSDGLRLGGTMELAGFDPRLRERRLDALERGAARFLSEPPPTGGERWCSYRPMTPDELPILDRVAPGIVLAAGHGMMGVSMAPATGELVAALVTGGEPPLDPGPYSLARFRG